MIAQFVRIELLCSPFCRFPPNRADRVAIFEGSPIRSKKTNLRLTRFPLPAKIESEITSSGSQRIFHSATEIPTLKHSITANFHIHLHSTAGRPTIWITVGQGPTALAVGAGGGGLDIFTLVYPFSPLSPSLWETARYRLKYCLKGPLNPKQPTNQLHSTLLE